MSEWISVEDLLPEEGHQVLMYWKDSRHMEDGVFYIDENTGLNYHALFDGESLNVQPSHWMPLPQPPETD